MFTASTTKSILVLFFIALIIGFATASNNIPGGFSHKQPTAKTIAKFSNFLSQRLADKYPTITQIIDVEQQVVAGVMYRVTALVKDINGQEKTIKAKIFQPLPHAIQAGQSKLQLKGVQEL